MISTNLISYDMSKEPKKNFNTAPWGAKRSLVSNFTLVTENNRKEAVVLGRLLYIFEPLGHDFLYRGCFSVDPLFKKGRYRYPLRPWNGGGHYSVYITEDMDYQEWKDNYSSLIQKFVKEGTLYYNSSEPLLTFVKE